MPMDSTWRAALLQITSGLDPQRSADDIVAGMQEACAQGAEFISTPEMSNFLPANRREAISRAVEESDDRVLAAAREAAARCGCWVHIGSLCLKGAGGKLLNRGFILTPSGDIAARYDKIHMFDVELGNGESYRESALYAPGSAATLAETPLAKLGMTICYDLRFPQVYEQLALAGADVLLVPAAFTQPTGQAHWETLLRARAIETGCFVLAAGQTGTHESGRKTHGHSMAIDPWGRVIDALERTPGILYCNIEMKHIASARSKIPALAHRKPFDVTTMGL
ncbi:MAG: carbon-nitrogen hydrolase family protein [Pseudomonadota bacterium]